MGLAALAVVGGGVIRAAEAPQEPVPDAVLRAEALGEAIQWASSRVLPSVVAITTEAEVKVVADDLFLPRDGAAGRRRAPQMVPPFAGPEGAVPPPQTHRMTRRGHGTGIIIDPDGYILTCRHVVDGAKAITVRLADGRSLDATVTGSDERMDLALLKVDATDLPGATLGDSDALRMGQPVIAIGHPFGLRNSISFGIVSGLHRRLDGDGPGDFIQTDATMGVGSAGGPLVTLRGEVVGMAVAVTSRPGGQQGFGLAIPANAAGRAIVDLMAGRAVARGYLGVMLEELPAADGQPQEPPGGSGALVAEVLTGSPADKAGFTAGDVITEFNGQPVKTIDDLPRLVAAEAPGTTVKIRIRRNGEQQELTVVLGERP
jgi:serine protease Do